MAKWHGLRTVGLLGALLAWGPLQAQERQWPQAPQHQPRVYVNDDGITYAPLRQPVFLGLALQPEAEDAVSVPDPKEQSGIPLKEGENLVRNLAVKSEAYTVIGDGTPPETQPNYPETPSYETPERDFIGQNSQFELVPTDALSGVWKTWVSYEGKPYVPAAGLKLNLAVDGVHTFKYFSVDHVGNEEPLQDLTLVVDLTAPVTQVIPEGPHLNRAVATAGRLVLQAEDGASGVDRIRYRIDEGKEQVYRKPLEMKDIPPGAHTLYVSAVDRVKNAEAWQTVPFQHDNQPPELEIKVEGREYRQDGVVYVSSSSPIRLVARDEFSEIKSLDYNLDDAEWIPYTDPFLPPQKAGLHWIGARVSDKAENEGIYRRRVYVDGTPPTTGYRISGSSSWNDDTVIIGPSTSIFFEATDLESRVEKTMICINDQECQPYDQPLSWSEDGDYTIRFYSIDNVNNQEKPQVLLVRVDQARWAGAGESGGDDAAGSSIGPDGRVSHRKHWFVSDEHGLMGAAGLEFFLRLSVSPEEDAPYFQMAYDPDDKDPQSLFFSQGGSQALGVGIPGTKRLFRINIDDTDPRTTARLKGANKFERGGTTYYSEGLVLELTARDAGKEKQSGVEALYYSIDGSGFVEYEEPIKLFFSEKVYRVSYYALDKVGNAEKVRSMEFSIDLAPPLTTHTVEGAFFGSTLSSQTTIELRSDDGLSGVAGIYYSFDNGTEQLYRRPLTAATLRNLPEGDHLLTYYAVDEVGNKETVRKLNFSLDHEPPAVSLRVRGEQHLANNGRTYVSRTTTFSLSAKEKSSEVLKILYAFDTGEMEPYTNTFGLPEVERRHTISFSSLDRVGNTTPRQSKDFYLDLTAPVTSHEVVGTQYLYRGELYLNADTEIRLLASDGGAGIRQTVYRINGGKQQPYKGPIRIKETGRYELSYYSVDEVGNTEEQKSLSFMVDATNPEVAIRSTPPFRESDGKFFIRRGSLLHIDTKDPQSGVREVFYSLNGRNKRLYRRAISRLPIRGSITLDIQVDDWVNNRSTRFITFEIE